MSLWRNLAEKITSKERLARIEEVLASRTDRIIPVFENLHKPHNAAAVLRTCDALGISSAHFIEDETDTRLSRGISKGSQNWVETRSHASLQDCIAALRSEGYILAGTCLSPNAVPPEELPLDKKIAVIFGNERDGISGTALEACEYKVSIPMHGFVESFNISVAAAILFYTHTTRLRAQNRSSWELSSAAKKKLRRRWLFYNTRLGRFLQNKKWRDRLMQMED